MKDRTLLNQELVYQIFVRQYAKKDQLKEITNDLDRIKELGATIIYLMPIFPIGEVGRKGSVGSPYSIKDYDILDPAYGLKEDLIKLIKECHNKGLKIIVDMVLNHSAIDAKLRSVDENYYFHQDGKISRKCDDWDDVIDFDYNNQELREKLILMLCKWANLGFDGYRMDVCSMVPLSFWKEAKERLMRVNPDILLIGESVDTDFLKHIRKFVKDAPSDLELYQVFDCLYQYDINKSFLKMKEDVKNLPLYLNDVLKEMETFGYQNPKLRYLENHDIPRIASCNYDKLSTIWALNFMLPGLSFVYMGSEFGEKHKPNLFEYDILDFTKEDILGSMFKKLMDIKKNISQDLASFRFEYNNKFLVIKYLNGLMGIYNFRKNDVNFRLDGIYQDLYNDAYASGSVNVHDFMILRKQ